MMDQLPNLGREKEMLNAMGMESIDELFSDIPPDIRITSELPLRDAQTEEQIISDARTLLGSNITSDNRPSFLGAGLYQNYVPALIPQLIGRGEFLTAYTPYQAEVSQGMLQAMWEFQSMICGLTGLDVSNVSVYDASTAVAEALTCAVRIHNKKAIKKDIVYVSELVPPHRMSVVHNYTQGGGLEIRRLPHNSDGTINLEFVKDAEGCCAVYVEQPNAYGILDVGLTEIKEIVGENTALIVGVQPTSLGLVEAPGNYGADIVIGEGQPFGSFISGGGPIYGIFSCTKKYLRQMPGRIVGKSIDSNGKEAYCLTLSTREQHIRRHRATSNLCTNETLIALMGAMHMALLGPEGVEKLSLRNFSASKFTFNKLKQIEKLKFPHEGLPHYNEFVVELPGLAEEALDYLDKKGLIGGFDLSNWYPDKKNWLLVCSTDQNSVADIELLVENLSEWVEVIR